MHGSFNRFMLQSALTKVGKGPSKHYRSENDPNKPGSSIDVEIKPSAYEIIEAVTKLKKELDGLPGTANGGELI